MELKIFEVRDRMTRIDVFAIDMRPDDMLQSYYLRYAGYPCDGEPIIVVGCLRANGDGCYYDPYSWPGASRTMREAHLHIRDAWPTLKSGDVIDVEYILGETAAPKVAERLESL